METSGNDGIVGDRSLNEGDDEGQDVTPSVRRQQSDEEETSEERHPTTSKLSRKVCGVPYWWWPTYESLLWKITIILIVLLVWGATWSAVGPMAAPGGGMFNYGVILMVAHYVSVIGSYFALPPLVGMLLVGVFFRNTKLLSIEGAIHPEILKDSRYLALTLVLIRAGLGLDPVALRKLSTVVPRLAFIPCLVEAGVVALASHLILGFPVVWGLLMGSVVGAVSPAVTVHYLLALKEKHYGEEKGIPTLIIAASSIDDILAITLFGVMSAIIFSSGSVAYKAFRGPSEALTGVVCGFVLGVVAIYLPLDNIDHVAFYRGIILASGSYFAVLGSHRLEMIGAGFMASIVSSFTASYGWKRRNWMSGGKPVQHGFTTAWLAMQHILFTSIGYQLELTKLQWQDSVLKISVLATGLMMRMVTTFIVVFGTGFNLKEHLFISIAWIPKATVQAALGPTALDLVGKLEHSDEERAYAVSILDMAVLGILITAPLGALGIFLTGPRLLSKQVTEESEQRVEPLPSPEREPLKKRFFGKCFRKKEEKRHGTLYELHRDSILITAENTRMHGWTGAF